MPAAAMSHSRAAAARASAAGGGKTRTSRPVRPRSRPQPAAARTASPSSLGATSLAATNVAATNVAVAQRLGLARPADLTAAGNLAISRLLLQRDAADDAFKAAVTAKNWDAAATALDGFDDAGVITRAADDTVLDSESRMQICLSALRNLSATKSARILDAVRRASPASAIAAQQLIDYQKAVTAKDWGKVTTALGGLEPTLMYLELSDGTLKHDDLVQVARVATHQLKTTTLVEQLKSVDAEAYRVGKLYADWDDASGEPDWAKAAVILNGFDDLDITRLASNLSGTDRQALLKGAGTTPAADRLTRILGGIAGKEETGTLKEFVGGNNFENTAAHYNIKVTPDAVVITEPMNFVPDPGLTVPTATWFGHITSIWNTFKAVNLDDPSHELDITFNPVAGPGGATIKAHLFQAAIGTFPASRADAANYYVNDPRESTAIPHEFGHLMLLEDEYERNAADHQRTTGTAVPTPTPADLATAQPIAEDLGKAVRDSESLLERHSTAVNRRIAKVDAVLAGAGIVANYNSGENALTQAVSKAYSARWGTELDRDFADRIDLDDDKTRAWREKTVGTFQFTDTSIMGDMTDHAHPVAARHVKKFAEYAGSVYKGRWEARPR